jgi:hypothetical protein
MHEREVVDLLHRRPSIHANKLMDRPPSLLPIIETSAQVTQQFVVRWIVLFHSIEGPDPIGYGATFGENSLYQLRRRCSGIDRGTDSVLAHFRVCGSNEFRQFHLPFSNGSSNTRSTLGSWYFEQEGQQFGERGIRS